MYLYQSHSVFPTPNIERTADFYKNCVGFTRVDYLDSAEPHICLYKDSTEIILTKTENEVKPNRVLYGYGYDAYFITDSQQELQDMLMETGVKIVRLLKKTDYHNQEFVIEDIDGRWIGFGIKEE
ncbi:VOC family protein [Anaerosporobacter sp.]